MATVIFRDLREDDLYFIHKCKNDAKLNNFIVGNWRPFSLEQSKKWLEGWMRADNPAYKIWAIATADDSQRMVGWISLSKIDEANKSAFFHGIVIGDPDYRDGNAWIESFLFLYNYVFIEKNFNRLSGSCLTCNDASLYITEAMLEKVEGIAREAVYKDGKFYDVVYAAILKKDYLKYIDNHEFDMKRILSRLLEARRNMKKKYNI